MPKEKSKRDTDTSDSGPEDIPPPKKAKGSKSSTSKQKNEEDSWSLEQRKFVKVREFKGKIFIDIREYYEADGELKPGKKGIALSPAQWIKLKEAMDEIDDSIKSKS